VVKKIEGMSVKLTQIGGFTRTLGLLAGFGFLSMISILVAHSPKQQTGLALIFAVVTILIPGMSLMRALRAFPNDYLAELVYGSAVIISLIILIHPIFAKFNLNFLTLSLVLVIGIISLFFSLKNKNFRTPKLINLKFIFLTFLILVFISIWIGIQARSIPASNLDLFVVEPDIYHHISIAAEITHHGGEIFPFVAGSAVKLIYHIGAFSLGSFLSFDGFFTLPVAMFRIEFIGISLLYIFSLFVVGKQISQKLLGGVAAVIIGALTLFPSVYISGGFSNPVIRAGSLSQLVGSTLMLLGLGLAFHISQKKVISPVYFVILLLISAATSLSKGPAGVMLVGVLMILALSDGFIEKSWVSLKSFIASLVGFLIVFPFIFEFSSTGSNGATIEISPLQTVRAVLAYQNIDVTRLNVLILFSVLFFSTISPLLIALPFLKEKKYQLKIFTLSSGVVAGVIGLFVFEIWGDSQWYIFYTIIPLVALLYALLAKIAVENTEVYTPYFYLSLGFFMQPILYNLINRWLEPPPIYLYVNWLVSSLFIILLSFAIAVFYVRTSLISGMQMAAVALAGIGLFSALTTNSPKPMPVGNYEHPWSITIGTQAVGDYLRNNSFPEDLLISNRHCVGPTENNPCHARVFALSALAERRVLLEGWSYTTCPLEDPLINRFWDDELYLLNQNVVLTPKREDIFKASRYGARWLVIDRQRPAAENFSDFATLEFSKGDMEIWKINNPSAVIDLPEITGCG
jgi:hypothetical protein